MDTIKILGTGEVEGDISDVDPSFTIFPYLSENERLYAIYDMKMQHGSPLCVI